MLIEKVWFILLLLLLCFPSGLFLFCAHKKWSPIIPLAINTVCVVLTYFALTRPAVTSISIAPASAYSFEKGTVQNVSIQVTPQRPDAEIHFHSSQADIVQFEKGAGELTGKLTAKKEGIAELYVNIGEVKSNRLQITVTLPQEPEDEAPENADSAGKADDTGLTPSPADTQAPEKIDGNESQTVYISKTGSKYHLNPACSKGNYSAASLSDALKKGLTPCKKCAK